ncbi:MAG: hypothetical protein QM767_07025 [Anaeromyxobacter sp.]
MPDPRDLAIRPLGLAEVIDRSVALTVRHFRPLFLAMLVLQAPALFLARLQSAGVLELLASAQDPDRALAALTSAARTSAGLLLPLLFLQFLATAAAAAIVAPSLDPRAAHGRPGAGRAAWAVLTAALLDLAALLLAPALGLLPGLVLSLRAGSLPVIVMGAVVGILGGLLLFLVVLLRLVPAPVVAAVEGRAGLAALLRSSRLMAPRPGMRLVDRPSLRASVVLLVALVLALSVNAVAGLPRAAVVRLAGGGDPLAFLAPLPLGLELAVTTVEALASAALQPFSLVAVVVLYYDRRARTEGLDLARWAESLEASP